MASPVDPGFLDVFRPSAGLGGAMSFARFMELALYHPERGYYARSRRRIGRTPETDFFTAASLGPLFGELVVEACITLLGPRSPGAHTFVEIGVESAGEGGGAAGGGVIEGVAHPFGAARTSPRGRPLVIPSPAVVFSNELFDAQPCHRVVRTGGRWHEVGVAARGDALVEVLLEEFTPEVAAVADRLPAAAEGYRIDLPLAAVQLVGQIGTQPWTGLFVAFDYGKSWRELAEEMPAGTVRAYRRHRQSGDLFAHPGEQDLTCHVCWDWLAAALAEQGFAAPGLESQEAFFVHHASAALGRIAAAEAGRFSSRKLGVMQLLHPGNMGQKFQVLWALRDQTGE
jgi:SAM-dependent MidA family methyltransferase